MCSLLGLASFTEPYAFKVPPRLVVAPWLVSSRCCIIFHSLCVQHRLRGISLASGFGATWNKAAVNTCRRCLSGWTSTRTSADSSLPFLRLLLPSPPCVSFCLSSLISNSLLRPAQSCRLSRCFTTAVLRAWSLEQRQPRTCQKCSLRPPKSDSGAGPGFCVFRISLLMLMGVQV